MSFEFTVLKAENGDCMLIHGKFNGQTRNILIDGGTKNTYKKQRRDGELKKRLLKIQEAQQRIDLLILTHVDDDHIAGLIKGFENNGLLAQLSDKVWFNSGKLIFEHFNMEPDESNFIEMDAPINTNENSGLTSIRQGVKFENYISEKGIWHQELIMSGQVIELFGIKFTILSPTSEKLRKLLVKWTRESEDSLTSSSNTDYDQTFEQLLVDDQFKNDKSVHNGSSIAFIFEYDNKKLLFLGDAHDDVTVKSIRNLGYSETSPLKLDYVKLSHHASQYNTSPEFLSIIDCPNFIVSTDGSRHNLPNKRTLARIENYFPQANLIFNYPNIVEEKIFAHNNEEMKQLKMNGLTITDCEQAFKL